MKHGQSNDDAVPLSLVDADLVPPGHGRTKRYPGHVLPGLQRAQLDADALVCQGGVQDAELRVLAPQRLDLRLYGASAAAPAQPVAYRLPQEDRRILRDAQHPAQKVRCGLRYPQARADPQEEEPQDEGRQAMSPLPDLASIKHGDASRHGEDAERAPAAPSEPFPGAAPHSAFSANRARRTSGRAASSPGCPISSQRPGPRRKGAPPPRSPAC